MKNASGTARIDLGPLRAHITKVKQSKKARAAQRRRLANIRAAAAAAATEAARASALRAWEAEESRLRDNPKPVVPTRVRFSPNLMVTEIPVSPKNDLPKAVQSPARLEDGPREELANAQGFPFNVVVAPFDNIDIDEPMDEEEDGADEEYTPYSMLFGKKGSNSRNLATRSNSPRKTRNGTPKKKPEKNNDAPSPTSPEAAAEEVANAVGKKKRKRSSQPGDTTTPPSSPSPSAAPAPSSDLSTSPESNSPKARKRRRTAQNNNNNETNDSNDPNEKPLGGPGGTAGGSKGDPEMNTEDTFKANAANGHNVEMKDSATIAPMANGKPATASADTADTEIDPAAETTNVKVNITFANRKASGRKKKKANGKKQGAAPDAYGKKTEGDKNSPVKANGTATAAAPVDDELEDLFAELKKNRAKQAAAMKKAGATPTKKRKGSKNNSPTPSGGPRRYTEEGFPIYTEDEIVNDQPKGLNGPCPYDCGCCV